MTICNLHRLPHSNTWMWRTKEGNRGNYMTYDNGKGILYQQDDNRWGKKLCTHERFQVCKTVSGTRKKLNRIFAPVQDDPTRENGIEL